MGVAAPGICVGNDVSEYLDTRESADREVLEGFLARVEEVRMPAFDKASWCTSTSIYWRRERGDPDTAIKEVEQELQKIDLDGKTVGS